MARKIFSRLIPALLIIALMSVPSCAASSFKESLLSLEGVLSVEDVVQSGDAKFAEKYVVTFEQPLDWNNPDSVTFPQRCLIGFNGFDRPNVMYVSGYNLNDKSFPTSSHEIADMFNGNYISVEYRFFSKSAPEGLAHRGTALWEYLTDEYASNDFHNIMEQLKDILSGTWVFTGTSKGGQATNVFVYYYPDDADAYVSYVAPFCDGNDDPRAFNALYNTIGNERYGEAKAKEYRDLMMDFQVEAIKNRDYLQPKLVKTSSQDLALYEITSGEEFEEIVVDHVYGHWQYSGSFESIDQVMKLPRIDDPSTDVIENKEFLDGIAAIISADMDSKEAEDAVFPYCVQAAKENGHYGLRLQLLRDELAKLGITMELTAEREKNFLAAMNFTAEQKRLFTFDPAMRNKMLEWTNTNQSNVIMIYGDSDPWYFMRLPETDNPNIHIFTSSNHAHEVTIKNMEEEYSNQIKGLLSQWLIEYPDIKPLSSSSSSGCNSGFFAYGHGLLLIALILKRKRH